MKIARVTFLGDIATPIELGDVGLYAQTGLRRHVPRRALSSLHRRGCPAAFDRASQLILGTHARVYAPNLVR